MYGDKSHFDPTAYENDHLTNAKYFINTTNCYSTSSFSSSPETYSTEIDMQSSCESLMAAFSQASLNSQLGSTSLDEYLDKDDQQEYETPSAETILFYEILQDFPDLATFICHKDFGVFAHLWLDLQQNIRLAKKPSHRPAVQTWLKSAALQIHFLLVTIVKTNPGNRDLKSEPRCMFSAFRRLKDRIEIMHQVFELIENGRVWFNQTPLQVIAPLFKAADKIEKDIAYFEKNPDVIPLVDPHSDHVILVDTKEITMEDISSRVLQTYNIMPYNSDSISVNNLDVQPFTSRGSSILTSFQQDHSSTVSSIDDLVHSLASGSSTPSHYVQNNRLDFQAPLLVSEEQPQHYYDHQVLGCTTGKSSLISQLHEQFPAPFSHIQPSWIHPASAWSVSVIPYASTNIIDTATASPTCAQDEDTIAGTVYTSCSTVRDLSLSPNSAAAVTGHMDPCSPLNTLSEDYSDYEGSTSINDDDVYVVSDADDDEDWQESLPPRRRSKRSIAAAVACATVCIKTLSEQDGEKPLRVTHGKRKSQQARKITSERQFTRRTATSYDSKTTHYLKSVFFDIYSSRDKLTKEQRRQVQKDTGLKPRNITYWFSNHKRRFQNSLAVYKKVVKESQGRVKSYDDFLTWRRANGLPDEVLDIEAVGLDIDETNKNTLVLE